MPSYDLVIARLTDYDATSAGRTNVNAAVKGILEAIDRAQTSDG